MSQMLANQVKKFTKWLILQKEIRMKQMLDSLNKDHVDYNQTVAQINKDYSAFLDKVHSRHQIINVGLVIIASISAISALVTTIFKIF
jgi:hypothetical protein